MNSFWKTLSPIFMVMLMAVIGFASPCAIAGLNSFGDRLDVLSEAAQESLKVSKEIRQRDLAIRQTRATDTIYAIESECRKEDFQLIKIRKYIEEIKRELKAMIENPENPDRTKTFGVLQAFEHYSNESRRFTNAKLNKEVVQNGLCMALTSQAEEISRDVQTHHGVRPLNTADIFKLAYDEARDIAVTKLRNLGIQCSMALRMNPKNTLNDIRDLAEASSFISLNSTDDTVTESAFEFSNKLLFMLDNLALSTENKEQFVQTFDDFFCKGYWSWVSRSEEDFGMPWLYRD